MASTSGSLFSTQGVWSLLESVKRKLSYSLPSTPSSPARCREAHAEEPEQQNKRALSLQASPAQKKRDAVRTTQSKPASSTTSPCRAPRPPRSSSRDTAISSPPSSRMGRPPRVRLSSSKATPENFGITDAGFFDDERRTRTISGQHDDSSFGAAAAPQVAAQEWTPTPRAIVGSLAASEDPDSSVNYDYFGTVGRGGFAKVTLVSSRRSSPCTSRNTSRRGSFDAAAGGAPGTPAAADRCCAVSNSDSTTDYAVKVCSKRSSASRCEMARREAKLLRELRRHPFIVTLR
jgi:hypothetical protein